MSVALQAVASASNFKTISQCLRHLGLKIVWNEVTHMASKLPWLLGWVQFSNAQSCPSAVQGSILCYRIVSTRGRDEKNPKNLNLT